MLTTRRRGGQAGNTNAVKHGHYSRATRERRALEQAARARHEREWAEQCPKVDYGRVIDDLARLRSQN